MDIGKQTKAGIKKLFDSMGQTLQLITDWNSASETATELRGILTSTKENPDEFVCLFPQPVPDLAGNSVIKPKMGVDLWQVIDSRDEIINDTYVMQIVRVRKITANGTPVKTTSRHEVVVQDSVIGAFQVGGDHNVQNIVVSTGVQKDLDELNALLRKSEIPELDKEDGLEAIERLRVLANRSRNDQLLQKAKERIDLLTGIISLGKGLHEIASPILARVSDFFAINSLT